MNNTQLELLDGYLDDAFDTIYEDNRSDERDFKIDRLKKLMTISDTPHYDYQLHGLKPDVKKSFKKLHNLYHNSLLLYEDGVIRREVLALDHYFKGTGDINEVRLQQEMAKKIHEFITELESGWRLDLIAYLGRNEKPQQNKIYLARQDKLIKYKLLNKNGQLITGIIIDTYSDFAMPNANKDWEDSEFRAIRKTIKEPILAILEDSDGKTALHWAAREGKEEIVKILLNKGADINAKDSDGETALHWAAREGKEDIVKILLSKGADINIRNKKGRTASDTAEKEKHINIVRIILFRKFVSEHFPNNDAALFNNPSSYFTTGKNKSKPIHVATINRNKPVIEFLIEKGAKINAKDSNGGTALHWAAWAGHIEVVKILLNNNANIRAKDNYSRTALHLATYKEYKKIVEMLANRKVDIINAKDMYSATALHWAAREGKEEIVKILLNKGADINAKDSNGETALHQAALNGSKETVELLLDKNAYIEGKDKDGGTALHAAALKGYTEVVKLLLNNNANIRAKGNYSRTALHWAAREGKEEIVKILLRKGADINAKDSDGCTALHWAAWAGHIEIVKILLSKGADINIKNKEGFTALGMAKHSSSAGVIKSIYEHQIRSVPNYFSEFANRFFSSDIGELCVNPSLVCTTGIRRKQPIHVAALNGNKQVLNFLIRKGADINAKDSDGETALHWAAREGKEDIVKILLNKGADINAKDSDGETALHWAAWLGYTEVVKLLLTNKADINIKNKEGFTALGMAKRSSSAGPINSIYEHQISSVPNYFSEFAKIFFSSDIGELCVNPSLVCTTGIRRKQPIHVAARHGNKQVLNFLIRKGADINAKDSDGETALHWAAREGKEDIVKILLNKGADINAKDSDGETALHWAAWLGYTEVVKLLLTNKADINIKNKEGFTALGMAKRSSSAGPINSIYEHQISSVPNYFSEFAKIFFSSDIGELCVNPSLACTTGIYRKQPIHVAARHGNKQVLNFLIRKEADINAKDSDGCTALYWAAWAGHIEVVKILLSKGADINIRNKKGLTASDTAEKEKHINIVRIILFRKFVSEHFPNNDAALFNNPSSDFTTGKNKSKPIHVAIKHRNKPVIEFLIEKGADINAKNSNGETALHWAAWLGYTEVVKILLNKGADINAKDSNGETALHWAALLENTEVVKILLTNKADINIKNKEGLTASDTAEKEKYINIVRIILFRKFVSEYFPNNDAALFNNPSSDFTTGTFKSKPIHVATINRNKPVIEFLIEKGADINAKDSDGETALHWAAIEGKEEIVKILLNKGADINAKDSNGETALHWAAREGKEEIVKILLSKGADINAKDNYSRTALHWAAWGRHKEEIVKILLSKGADINAKNSYGGTALHWAAITGQEEIVKNTA